jgi:copper homeostasis protein
VFTKNEILQSLSDIQFCKTAGCEGVVIGSLKKNGSINMKQTKQMVKAATPMRVTFHRAFDEGNNLLKNLEDIIICGCDALLTAGQSKNINSGISNLEQLVTFAKGRIAILAGSGVNHTNVEPLYKIGIRNFHLSGSIKNQKIKLETHLLLIKKMKDKLDQIV